MRKLVCKVPDDCPTGFRSVRHRPAKPVGKVLAASADMTQGLAGRQAAQRAVDAQRTQPGEAGRKCPSPGHGGEELRSLRQLCRPEGALAWVPVLNIIIFIEGNSRRLRRPSIGLLCLILRTSLFFLLRQRKKAYL
ncbi:hypothetical protein [uncultured Bacteroides sp.]|uniref:hypothetical protein n=1 Tax=uncultured Bacteroides sp. TaxID=162156 RepID=UPI002590A5C0|nr:hypothetical protein [uncultured Bacteroides sp.]